jgi:sulfite dehydrogenase (quinone) subunit SoeC
MNPAFSVIFLTTLIGVGQGLFLALFSSQTYTMVGVLPTQPGSYYAVGGLLALGFLVTGLICSFFHLGHPERAWRAASQWRTSWLSREVIALPLAMGLIFVYALLNWVELDADLYGWGLPGQVALTVGSMGAAASLILFLCTGMIYAAIKFLQEWSTPFTVVNFFLLGSASGFTFAAAYASVAAPGMVEFYTGWPWWPFWHGLHPCSETLGSNGFPACNPPSGSVITMSSNVPWGSWVAPTTPANIFMDAV